MKHKKYIIANWKMNPQTQDEAKLLIEDVANNLQRINNKEKVEIILMPPYVWLNLARTIQQQYFNIFSLGAQNTFWKEYGAYTGEISPQMIKNLNCQYVLLGHSERKLYFNETVESINKKLLISLKIGLTPVLCLNPKQDFTEEFNSLMKNIEKQDMLKIVFVYEPTEAISTQGGKTPSFKNMASAVKLIKQSIINIVGEEIAKDVVLIYGGSVNSQNVKQFTIDTNLDGVLVGAKSLIKEDFISIIKQLI